MLTLPDALPLLLSFFDFYVLFIYFFFSLFIYLFIYFYFFSFPLFLPFDTWLNVSHSHKCTTCHAMCHLTPNVSKNVKFRLSRNLTKFNGVTIFRETNSTMKSVSSSEIYKMSGFQPNLPFYHFSKIRIFWVSHY